MSPTLPKAGPVSVPQALAIHGALLIDKPAGMSSFGVIERLQRAMLSAYGESHGLRKRDLPKLGHGGTLDPFATGLLAVCVGDGVKLARYFLGSRKTYEGTIRFGETTASGDLTNEITARTERLPESLAALREAATTDREPLRQQALDGAADYQIDRLVERYWRPLFAELEAQIRRDQTTPRGVVRTTCDGGSAVPLRRLFHTASIARLKYTCSGI
jgi:phage gp36-like protein